MTTLTILMMTTMMTMANDDDYNICWPLYHPRIVAANTFRKYMYSTDTDSRTHNVYSRWTQNGEVFAYTQTHTETNHEMVTCISASIPSSIFAVVFGCVCAFVFVCLCAFFCVHLPLNSFLFFLFKPFAVSLMPINHLYTYPMPLHHRILINSTLFPLYFILLLRL